MASVAATRGAVGAIGTASSVVIPAEDHLSTAVAGVSTVFMNSGAHNTIRTVPASSAAVDGFRQAGIDLVEAEQSAEHEETRELILLRQQELKAGTGCVGYTAEHCRGIVEFAPQGRSSGNRGVGEVTSQGSSPSSPMNDANPNGEV